MKTKKKNRLWHCLLLVTSDEYREGLDYDEGEELWKSINKGLAPPQGDTTVDKQRISLFADRFKTTLTHKEQKLLVRWIKNRLEHLLHDDEEEDLSFQIIVYKHKWIRIYQQHLAAIS